MSVASRHTPELEQHPAAAIAEEAPPVHGWPQTRMPAWSMTLLLALGLIGPSLLWSRGPGWLALLAPALVSTLSARALFEALSLARGSLRPLSRLSAAVPSAVAATALIMATQFIVGLTPSPTVILVTIALALSCLCLAAQMRDLEIRVRLSLRRVFFIGATEARRDLEREISRHHDARLVGTASGAGPVHSPDALLRAVLDSRATVVVMDGEAMRQPALVEVASRLNLAGLRVRDLVGYYESEFKKVPLSELSPTWFLFDIASIHRRRAYRSVRRAVELVLAAVWLALALPVLAFAAVAIRLDSYGPVLYRQRRTGKAGEEFVLLKLRTMYLAGEPEAEWAGTQTHRVTPVGRLLRRFRLDELPQLWNVLRGDLALVGPRPEQVPIARRLEGQLSFYGARHCIRPGLTGWAQVNLGYGGSVEGTIAKLQKDLYYVKHASVRLDMLILWLTFKAVIAGRG